MNFICYSLFAKPVGEFLKIKYFVLKSTGVWWFSKSVVAFSASVNLEVSLE